MKIPVTINETKTLLEAAPDELLINVLRNSHCPSVKSGCEEGFCGSCTILVNDKNVASCKCPAGLVKDCEIITLDHFSKREEYSCIMEGFRKAGIQLCGYCNAGKIFSTYQILKMNKKPSRTDIIENIKHLSPCCVDLETLVNGIIYAVNIYNKKEKRS